MITAILISLGLILLSLACGSNETTSVNQANKEVSVDRTPGTEVSSVVKKPDVNSVDVPKFVNKTSGEFDRFFGPPEQITPVKNDPKMMPGEYRLYKVEGHPKGLSVRFYKDRAKRFNLILGNPANSSRSAILEVFKINLGSIKSDTISEPLSEKWHGKFNGIEFLTVYAKREMPNSGFTMVHAEIAN